MPGPRSRIRSDYALRLLLEKILEYGLSDHIRNLVEDAQRHMGYRSPYRGGRTLTDLLRQAHAGARAEDDQDTAERLEDALSYATNMMLAPDLEIKYQLLGGARSRYANALTTFVSISATFVADQVRTFLDEHPQATRDELMAYLDEMKRLAITDVAGAAGVFEVSRSTNEQAIWMTEVLLDRLHTGDSGVGVTPTAEASAEEIADVVLLRARRRALRELDAVVLNRHSSERDLQRALEKNLWIFGGTQLADRLGPRRISRGIELDLTLLRPDGTVHVVELKRAAVALLTHQRGRWVPTNEVHRAVAQAMNYLVVLDEDRARLVEQGIDVRRASAVVIIGHPQFEEEASENEVDTALRVYNSHLSRVEVVTYKQVVDRADRVLRLVE
ncbi:Shedu anti-phage system protein SduA domain-containing protein [Micromonospora oryzae]|uniref:Shedu anti-phage system protein SduA domain-containing protein n=1 Tax=Micromonospora sp. DSM 102119 TaxID=3111768 RepID=UPI0031DA99D5